MPATSTAGSRESSCASATRPGRGRLAGAVQPDVELDEQLAPWRRAAASAADEPLGRGATPSTATVSSTPSAASRARRSHLSAPKGG